MHTLDRTMYFHSIWALLSLVAGLITYFYVRSRKQEYKELPETLTYSGFWRRTTASLLDCAILIALSKILFFSISKINIYTLLAYKGMIEETRYYVFYVVVSSIVSLLYYTLQQASTHQATIGMRVMGIKIYNASLERPTLPLLIGRYFSAYLSALPLFIGLLMIVWTRRNQALHDKIARTVVCRQW